MMSHLFLYKECGSLLILSFTSSIGKCNTALVILAIALFSRSWFPLFRILPQTASWYEVLVVRIARRRRPVRRGVVRRWGHLQRPADGLNPELILVHVDIGGHLG